MPRGLLLDPPPRSRMTSALWVQGGRRAVRDPLGGQDRDPVRTHGQAGMAETGKVAHVQLMKHHQDARTDPPCRHRSPEPVRGTDRGTGARGDADPISRGSFVPMNNSRMAQESLSLNRVTWRSLLCMESAGPGADIKQFLLRPLERDQLCNIRETIAHLSTEERTTFMASLMQFLMEVAHHISLEITASGRQRMNSMPPTPTMRKS